MAMTSGTNSESVAYAGTIGFTGNASGVSEEFTPTAVPEPSTFGLIIAGAIGFLGAGWRRLRAGI